MNIKNIVFDFGGVLVDWNPRHLYKNVFSDEEEMEYFLNNVCTMDWNHQQDAGRSFEDGVKELAAEFPNYKDEITKYHTQWPEMLGGEMHHNTSLIDKLKEKYRLFGLTNWSAEKFPIAYELYPFFQKLEGIVVSGDEKIAKPDEKIFMLLLSRYGIQASESLFIDDSKPNIETAQRLGFQTIHYHNEVNLKKEFDRMGLAS